EPIIARPARGLTMRTTLRTTHVGMVSGLLICAVAAPALRAQESDGSGLEEIVVTATRKAESLSRVAVSVSALTQQNMDDAGVRDLSDIQKMTPGLQFSPQAGPS